MFMAHEPNGHKSNLLLDSIFDLDSFDDLKSKMAFIAGGCVYR